MAIKLDPLVISKQLSEINKGLQMIADLEIELGRAERCGADCQSRREHLNNQRIIFETYKREYFPAEQ